LREGASTKRAVFGHDRYASLRQNHAPNAARDQQFAIAAPEHLQ
jgi:hypothetical protein